MIDHLKEAPKELEAHWLEPQVWGSWLTFKGDYTPNLGKAVQAMLQLDARGLSSANLLTMAQHQLSIRGATEAITPAALVAHVQQFQQWLDRLTPEHIVAKYPLEATLGQRKVVLDVDLVVTADQELTALVFAGFAEGMKKWQPMAHNMMPPAGWVQTLLEKAYPEHAVSVWLVFPMEGAAVPLQRGR
jgi:hypothetical protein